MLGTLREDATCGPAGSPPAHPRSSASHRSPSPGRIITCPLPARQRWRERSLPSQLGLGGVVPCARERAAVPAPAAVANSPGHAELPWSSVRPWRDRDLKGANIRVASRVGEAWEDRRHGVLVALPRRAGAAIATLARHDLGLELGEPADRHLREGEPRRDRQLADAGNTLERFYARE
jgi:hypothetical protein